MKRSLMLLLILLTCSFAFTGCAAKQGSRCGYQSRAENELRINKVTDAEAIDLFNRIYAQKVDTRADAVAKDITLTAFVRGLKERHSFEIESSGVMNKPFNSVELKQWTDEDLINAYNALTMSVKKTERQKSLKKYPNATATMDSHGRKTYWEANTSEPAVEVKKKPLEEEDVNPMEVIRLTAIYSIGTELSQRDEAEGQWDAVGFAIGTGISIASEVAVILAKFLI